MIAEEMVYSLHKYAEKQGRYQCTNGIVNLQVTLPDAVNAYDIHITYVYNCSVGFSKGSAELIF